MKRQTTMPNKDFRCKLIDSSAIGILLFAVLILGSPTVGNDVVVSSEFHDDETGLVYYNYRYYSPALGRWTRRDPIGENGTVNLYGLITNDAVCPRSLKKHHVRSLESAKVDAYLLRARCLTWGLAQSSISTRIHIL
jgi:RHS repeat-associated protein